VWNDEKNIVEKILRQNNTIQVLEMYVIYVLIESTGKETPSFAFKHPVTSMDHWIRKNLSFGLWITWLYINYQLDALIIIYS